MLSQENIDAFLRLHIAHRLVLLRTFRDRQGWFAASYRDGQPDGDLLRVAKESSLLGIRLFAQFLGLRLDKSRTLVAAIHGKRADDVYVDDLGGHLATVEAFQRGIAVIERLLVENLYAVVVGPDGQKYPFPDLRNERRIHGTGYEVVGGPLPLPTFPRK